MTIETRESECLILRSKRQILRISFERVLIEILTRSLQQIQLPRLDRENVRIAATLPNALLRNAECVDAITGEVVIQTT
jgi:hypothetical protein